MSRSSFSSFGAVIGNNRGDYEIHRVVEDLECLLEGLSRIGLDNSNTSVRTHTQMDWKDGLDFLVLMILLPCLRDVLPVLGLGIPLNQAFHFFSHIQKYDAVHYTEVGI